MNKSPEQFRLLGLTLCGVAVPMLHLFYAKDSDVLFWISSGCAILLGISSLKKLKD
jgi:hypothetical protein